MSKENLQQLTYSVIRNLVERGFKGVSNDVTVEDSGTDGWYAKFADFGNGQLEIWFDAYMNRGEKKYYYGYFSSDKSSTERVCRLFDIGNNVVILKDVDSEEAETGYYRFKKTVADGIDRQYIFERYRKRYFFGRYAVGEGDTIIEEASAFFEIILQSTPQGSFLEGANHQVTTNRYERDPAARAACLKTHGYKCKICSFDFEATYGELGKEFIHVHHLNPVAMGVRMIDPIKDLIPVCPNCHAMIHRRSPPIESAKLQHLLVR